MKKKLIAFDLDGTLAPSKSPLPDRMAGLLEQLLSKYQVCVISGGRFELFQRQLLNNLAVAPEKLRRLHLMPTCGTRYHSFLEGEWQIIYSEDLSKAQKQKIAKALKKGATHLGYDEKKTYGEVIEDRLSQISWSAMGQDLIEVLGEEGLRIKEEWDPTDEKKRKLRDYVAGLIPEFEVRVGGLSTVDVTKPGIDKAYGIQKLLDMLSIKKNEVLFVGDKLYEGGNDFPVKAMGIDCVEVKNWQETALVVEAIILVS